MRSIIIVNYRNDKKEFEIDSLTTKIDSLTADVALLRKKIAKLENSLDDEDAYVRRETIIFNGTVIPPATTG